MVTNKTKLADIFTDSLAKCAGYLDLITQVGGDGVVINSRSGNFATGTALSLAREVQRQYQGGCEIAYIATEPDPRVQLCMVDETLVLSQLLALGTDPVVGLSDLLDQGLPGGPLFSVEHPAKRIIILDLHTEDREPFVTLAREHGFTLWWVSHLEYPVKCDLMFTSKRVGDELSLVINSSHLPYDLISARRLGINDVGFLD